MLGSLSAQPGEKPDEEKLRSLKVAFLTQKLNLNTSEAEKFWPVYNEFEAERQEVERIGDRDVDFESMSDKEVEDHILAQFDRMEKMSALNKKYLGRFKTVLPDRKAAMVFVAEHEFVREVMRHGRGRGPGHEGRGGPDGRPGPPGGRP